MYIFLTSLVSLCRLLLISLRGVLLPTDGEIRTLHCAEITGEDKPINKHMSLSIEINIMHYCDLQNSVFDFGFLLSSSSVRL